MLSYADQNKHSKRCRATERDLRRAISTLSARQRREAIVRAAIAPIGPIQELRRAVEVERVVPGLDAEVSAFIADVFPEVRT